MFLKLLSGMLGIASFALVLEGFWRAGDWGLFLILWWGTSWTALLGAMAWSRTRRGRAFFLAAAIATLGLLLDYALVAQGTFFGGSDSFRGFSLVSFLLAGPLTIAAGLRSETPRQKIGLALMGTGFALWMPVGVLTTVDATGYLVTSLVGFGPAAVGSLVLVTDREL